MLKLYISFAICRNSDIFQSILNIFRDLLNTNKTNVLIQAVLIFSNFPKMIKIDRNMSELRQIVCENIILKLVLVLLVY
jgi:hypothetical protein